MFLVKSKRSVKKSSVKTSKLFCEAFLNNSEIAVIRYYEYLFSQTCPRKIVLEKFFEFFIQK